MKGTVKWGSYYSDEFEVYNGIKQDGVLSPTLFFSLYLDELIKIIHGTNLECYVGNLPSSIFIYADDIFLLTPTHNGMRKLIKICERSK